MEILKYSNRAKDFYPYSRRINGSILKYVPIDATKKTGKKTSRGFEFEDDSLFSIQIYFNRV